MLPCLAEYNTGAEGGCMCVYDRPAWCDAATWYQSRVVVRAVVDLRVPIISVSWTVTLSPTLPTTFP